MQISTALFTDPAQRAGLRQYYETMKSDAVAALKARESAPDFQATINGSIRSPDGAATPLSGNLITAAQMEKAFVPFDQWLETTQKIHESQQKMYESSQRNLTMLESQHPDTSSGVRATFAHDGNLLAHINQDGNLAYTNAVEKYLSPIAEKANALNLSGPSRAAYLHREIEAALSQHFDGLDTESYTAATAPSKRAFAAMWHKDFNIDAHYESALTAARAQHSTAQKWHDQMQANLQKMQNFLLKLQESEAA